MSAMSVAHPHIGRNTPNTCCSTAECKHETKNASAQLQTWLAEQSASEAAPFGPTNDTTETTKRTGQPIRLDVSG